MFNYGMAPQMVYATPPAAQQAANAPNKPPGATVGAVVIDGTPLRVVVLALAASAGLVALRLGGFRFNVGVSS